ncbi:MAG: hypothetical protein Q9219_006104 [cf. Caloplaca sp. 3 TL-2023]
MAKALAPKSNNSRSEPYPAKKPIKRDLPSPDKENADQAPKKRSKPSPSTTETQDRPTDYRSIPLPQIAGEVPCYDDASTVRRKLNLLLTNQSKTIPGTDKKWSQAAIAREMQELERRDGAVEYGKNSYGPSARTLGTYLKKTGKMAGGDSPIYYWGYVLLEKMRVWEGGKKTKTRVECERV